MRRLRTILLAFLILGVSILAGYAQFAPLSASAEKTFSPRPVKTFAAVPKPLAAPPVIKLRYADPNPEVAWGAINATKPWLKQIEDAAGGRIKIESYFSQTLTKSADSWAALKTGVADMAWVTFVHLPGMATLSHDLISLPFLGVPSAETGSAVLWQLYEKYPAVQKQLSDNKMLIIFSASPNFLVTTNRQVRTLEDLRGMKIRTPGGPPVEMIKALGAVPVTLPMPDLYLAFQKGVVDGAVVPWEAILAFRFYELTKYYTIAPFNCAAQGVAMNIQTWNSLGPELQNQLMSVSGLTGSRTYGKNFFDSAADAVDGAVKGKKYEMNVYTLPAEELIRWRKIAGEPLWEGWVKAQEARGFAEARTILNAVLQMLKDYK